MRFLSTIAMLFIAASVTADPITIGADTFQSGIQAFPAKVEIVGHEITETSIADSYTYLEGDDLQVQVNFFPQGDKHRPLRER